MSLVYFQNFDQLATGALAGWTAVAGTWTVQAGRPWSAANAFGEASGTNGHIVVNTGMTVSANMTVQCVQRVNLDGSNNGVNEGIVLRCDSNAQNGYFFLPNWKGVGEGVTIFKRVGGSFTSLNGSTTTGLTLADGDFVWFKCEATGTTLRWKAWKDGTAEPGSWTVSITDAAVSAAGAMGFYTGTNSGGAGPGGIATVDQLTIDDDTAVAAIAVNDANLFLSPYNWYVNGSTSAKTINPGAYIKAKFNGVSCVLNMDNSSLVTGSEAAARWPYIQWSIDGGPWTTQILTTSLSSMPLAGGLADTAHTLELHVKSIDGLDDRWTTPVNCVTITGLSLYNGKALSVPTLLSKRALMFGDSIMEAAWCNGVPTVPSNYSPYQDATVSWAAAVAAQALLAEYGNVSAGGQGWDNAGINNVPGLLTSYDHYFTGQSRLVTGKFSPIPDYVLINMGANGSPTQAHIQTTLQNIRAAAGLSAKIMIVTAFAGTNYATIVAAFNAVADSQMYLVDMGSGGVAGLTTNGTATFASYDGLHPNSWSEGRLAALVLGATAIKIVPTQATMVGLAIRI